MEAMSSLQHRERVLIVRTERDQSGRISVAVADAGAGIEPENLNRIFVAFHTTNDAFVFPNPMTGALEHSAMKQDPDIVLDAHLGVDLSRTFFLGASACGGL